MDAIPVCHEDEHILVVAKPPGLLVLPAPGRAGPNLVDALSRARGERLYPVHRLDEDTSGAYVLARTEAGRTALDAMFRAHAVERIYLALVAGTPSPPAGRIESRLQEGKDGVVRVVTRGGERAVTHYETLARRGPGCLVRCRLETGRRNQIRAHLAALGCPIAGDRKYGYRQRGAAGFGRVMLHSWRLAFRHPVLGTEVRVTVAPPEPELMPDADDETSV